MPEVDPNIDAPPAKVDPNIDAPPNKVDPNFHLTRENNAAESYRGTVCSLLSNYIIQLLTMALYILFAVSSIHFMDNDYYGNTTIYTQALADWTNEPWVDFVWNQNGVCPSGYEPISANWMGTSNGNITKGETIVVPNESRYGCDYRYFDPIDQTKIFTNM